jgi:predicted Ser/Thr protein kinase
MIKRHDALAPGVELGAFRIERVIGSGGFGVTYLAAERASGNRVAIKEYLPAGVATRIGGETVVRPMKPSLEAEFKYGLGRFRDEARALATLQHPNIVPVLEFFEGNGTGYLVMTFLDGRSLGDLLESGMSLADTEIVATVQSLLEGLSVVHANGYLHRDIKPDNILIRRDGTPILIDFGSAREALRERSRSLTVMVTTGYAPHEQYSSQGNQGPWSDLYALGAVIYRCVTGQRPHDALQRAAAIARGGEDPMPSATALAAGRFAPPLLAAVDQALNIDEAARPQSCAEFLAALSRDPAEAPPVKRAMLARQAVPTPPAAAPISFTIARPALVAAVIALLVLIGAGAGLGGYLLLSQGAEHIPRSTASTLDAAPPPASPGAPDREAEARRRKADEDAERRRAEEERRRKEEERRKLEDVLRHRRGDNGNRDSQVPVVQCEHVLRSGQHVVDRRTGETRARLVGFTYRDRAGRLCRTVIDAVRRDDGSCEAAAGCECVGPDRRWTRLSQCEGG